MHRGAHFRLAPAAVVEGMVQFILQESMPKRIGAPIVIHWLRVVEWDVCRVVQAFVFIPCRDHP